MADASPSHFIMNCTGQIESAYFPGLDNLYCKFNLHFGQDWTVIQGLEEGITQITNKADGVNEPVVWNFPLDVTFKSSNAFGWPQLVLSVYGVDTFGRDVVLGYGTCYFPLAAGRYTQYVRMFVPMSSSVMQKVTAFFTGAKPEYVDPTFIAGGQGRELTRVKSHGVVKVQMSIVTKDMVTFGFSSVQSSFTSPTMVTFGPPE
mmetsp:Transcript_21252/g.36485  ORF Transcript_21252/g.36485 Transcript_21252/m.36485 type:complete len:203 (+) Transcript_21252:18-626(+)